MKNMIVGISGASGVIYGIKLLKVLSQLGVKTHLIITETATQTIALETNYNISQIENMATEVYNIHDFNASIASGSFLCDGMVIAPCSIKTLSGISNSFNYNLLIRAADVMLKEKRKLVILVRETPLHAGHLGLMLNAAKLGAVILPPIPAFYHQPKTIDDIIKQILGKVLDQFNIEHNLFTRWNNRK